MLHSSYRAQISILLSFRFPKKYIFPNAPQLAQWDDQLKSWRTGKLQDVEVTLGETIQLVLMIIDDTLISITATVEDRSVSFKTLQFAPVAFMSVSQFSMSSLYPSAVFHNKKLT